MSYIISVDSSQKEVGETQFNFHLTPELTKIWKDPIGSFNNIKESKALSEPTKYFSTELELIRLPYHTSLLDIPEIYISFEVKNGSGSRNFISSSDRRRRDYPFICKRDEVVNNSLGTPTWIYYKCVTRPVQILEVNSQYVYVRIADPSGVPLTIYTSTQADIDDPDYQTHVVATVTPLKYDGIYNNIDRELKYS